MRISDWSSDVCSSDLQRSAIPPRVAPELWRPSEEECGEQHRKGITGLEGATRSNAGTFERAREQARRAPIAACATAESAADNKRHKTRGARQFAPIIQRVGRVCGQEKIVRASGRGRGG